MNGLDVWGKHKPYIELLAHINNSCVFFVELTEPKYYFISTNFKDFYGFDPHDQSVSIDDNIHPDDRLMLEKIQQRLLNFIEEIPDSNYMDFKHIFEFRVHNRTGGYIRVISQQQIIEVDDHGKMYLLGIIDISPDQNIDSNIRFRLMNTRTGELIPFAVNEDNEANFTKREREVLRLVNEGMLSKEISEALSISICTVNRHRQNILEKVNANNSQEAIRYAKKLGLLE